MSDTLREPPAHPRAAWRAPLAVAGIMVALALIGIAFAAAKLSFAPDYWVSLVPIYGVLCTVVAWRHTQQSGEQLVLRQILHWAGIAAALALDFYLPGVGIETQVATGLDALLLLALGSYLAGVHLAWPFYGVGGVLTLTLVIVAKAEQYLWVLLLAALAAGVLAFWLHRRRRSGTTPTS